MAAGTITTTGRDMSEAISEDPIERAFQAITSQEYQDALAAQIDYDSTPEGQKKLVREIGESNDPAEVRSLTARKVAGEHARMFLREFVAFLPPALDRKHPGYASRRALVKSRDELVRLLACAAAESNVWTKPSPVTIKALRVKLDEIVAKEKAAGHAPSTWRHPHLLAASQDRAPWLPHRVQRQAHVGDVALLIMLGMDASWHGTYLRAIGDPDPMFRWGYNAAPAPDGNGWIVATAPDLTAWQRLLGSA